MVEMAGYIIMGYLLLIDTNRDRDYLKSARTFVKIAKSQVRAHAEFIGSSSIDDLGNYKYQMV